MADRQVDRHGPALGLPVIGALGVDPEGRRGLVGVAEERLDEGLADVGPVVLAGVGERPDVVGQHAVGVAVLLLEQQGGGTRAPLLGPQVRPRPSATGSPARPPRPRRHSSSFGDRRSAGGVARGRTPWRRPAD